MNLHLIDCLEEANSYRSKAKEWHPEPAEGEWGVAAEVSLFCLSAKDIPQGVYPSAHMHLVAVFALLGDISTDTARPTQVQGFV